MNDLWSEVKIAIPSEMGELAAEILQEEGAGGIVFDDPEILGKVVLQHDEIIAEELAAKIPAGFALKAYFPVDDRLGERLRRVKERLRLLLEDEPQLILAQVKEEDWADAWKAYFKPERLGRVVIKPSWESYTPAQGEIVVDLDPGMAFGTGTHPTTRLCITMMQKLIIGETRLLDVGTGSGILAITAAKLGAAAVVASDVDSLAVRVAQENITRNGLEGKVAVLEGDLLNLAASARSEASACSGKFNLIVANIIADIIIRLIPDVERFLEPGGRFLASGIIGERAGDVRAKLAERGYTVLDEVTEDGWVAVLAAKA